ncbi:hypothetical protein SLEP1_g908 [Rubroshorea leprosula]|uniref:Uncharacterized protein n=1 Tax=Rubroshorea leprosula TaxID=152421 RepID=A0AAV5HKE2_9ROSI|nr:hypothetical protein SLEP1_g908 [Rubroshorea leprosula]
MMLGITSMVYAIVFGIGADIAELLFSSVTTKVMGRMLCFHVASNLQKFIKGLMCLWPGIGKRGPDAPLLNSSSLILWNLTITFFKSPYLHFFLDKFQSIKEEEKANLKP